MPPGVDARVLPPLLLLLLLLGPVPGGGAGCEGRGAGGCCPPCPPCGQTDTRCQPCAHNGTLSAASSTEGPCQPCTPTPGTLCTPEDPERSAGHPVTGDPSAATPRFVPPEGTGKDIIPVYCSLLAAVVVGLLAYVAFKCWQSCRQKQQLAKARAGDTGTSPDGEKLHSDSGVFLDTHSLQEHPPPGKGHPLGLSLQRQEELERLLEAGVPRGVPGGVPGGDWRSLATHLGFGPDLIGTLGRGRAPTRALLSAWAGTEGTSLESLCQALVAIGRQDAAQRLVAPGDVTSVV